MNTMQNFSRNDLFNACYYIYAVFLGFKTKIPGWCVITRMDAMQNFLQLISLVHVIVYVFFFFGF